VHKGVDMKNKRRIQIEIDPAVYHGMVKRAKIENAFVNEKGWVNIPALAGMLVKTYAEGEYHIVLEKRFESKKEERKL
jgi:hypothetical protein